jgi:hypothetical protein
MKKTALILVLRWKPVYLRSKHKDEHRKTLEAVQIDAELETENIIDRRSS